MPCAVQTSSHPHACLFRYLIGVAFADAALSSFSVVAATYLVTQMGASGTELALVILR